MADVHLVCDSTADLDPQFRAAHTVRVVPLKVIFGEQTYVIAAREQTVEQPAGFLEAALQNVIVDEPKTARQESSFACG